MTGKTRNQIIDEITDTVAYFEKNSGKKIKSAVLVGGSSQMTGLLDYFATKTKLPTTIGFSQLNRQKSPLEYIEAIGLALRALVPSWGLRDPEIKSNN